MSTSILVSAFSPFPSLTLSADSSTPFSALPDLLAARYPALPPGLVLSTNAPHLIEPRTPLSALHASGELLTLRLGARLPGGKGGFGSQLRAAGGRMSSQKTSNNDSCRDLSGRRLSTIKEAQKLAEYMASEEDRKKAASEAQRAKLEALEKRLGIVPKDKDGASSSSAKPGESEPVAGKKHRFDDTEYLEQSREIVDNVKNAVSVAMLKKKKKAKLTHAPADAKAGSKASAIESTSASVSGEQGAPTSATAAIDTSAAATVAVGA